MTNNSSEPLIFIKDEPLCVVDLRSIGYCRVNRLLFSTTIYEFKPLQVLYEEFSMLTNSLKREEQKSTGPYPWLPGGDERRNLTDRDIEKIY